MTNDRDVLTMEDATLPKLTYQDYFYNNVESEATSHWNGEDCDWHGQTADISQNGSPDNFCRQDRTVIGSNTGSEIRPKNMRVVYIMKIK